MLNIYFKMTPNLLEEVVLGEEKIDGVLGFPIIGLLVGSIFVGLVEVVVFGVVDIFSVIIYR